MSTPPSKFFNRYEFDEDVRDERDRLRTLNGQLLEVLACAKGLLEWRDKQHIGTYGDTCGPFGYIRDTDGSRKQIKLLEAAIAEAQKATGTQP